MNLTIVGNLTADPELRYTAAGVPVARFTVAHTPRKLDRATGQWSDGDPTYLDCTAWRHLAEHLAESLARGARVIVVGTLGTERWDDKATGEKRSRMVLAVEAAGPELTYATARPQKMARRSVHDRAVPADDPWQTATAERPVSPAPAGTA